MHGVCVCVCVCVACTLHGECTVTPQPDAWQPHCTHCQTPAHTHRQAIGIHVVCVIVLSTIIITQAIHRVRAGGACTQGLTRNLELDVPWSMAPTKPPVASIQPRLLHSHVRPLQTSLYSHAHFKPCYSHAHFNLTPANTWPGFCKSQVHHTHVRTNTIMIDSQKSPTKLMLRDVCCVTCVFVCVDG